MPDVASAELDAAQNAIIVAATTYKLSLHTADPTGTGAHEGGDGRQSITFGASSGAVQASSDSQTWASPVGGYTYTYFGIWTNAATPVYLRGGPWTAAFTPIASIPFTINTGAVILTAN